MRKKQKVADMADEVQARQARTRAERTGESFEEALKAVLETKASSAAPGAARRACSGGAAAQPRVR